MQSNKTRINILLLSLVWMLQQWNFVVIVSLPSVPTSTGFVLSPTRIATMERFHHNLLKKKDTCCKKTTRQFSDAKESDQISVEERIYTYVNNLQKDRQTGTTKAAKSLLYFLKQETFVESEQQIDQAFVDAMERALTQALRLAGEVGDYRLISQLIENSIRFADDRTMLTPRIFGEAIDALSKTTANVSKMKQVWNLVARPSKFLTRPLPSYELNVFLKALGSRQKAKACSETYRQHTDESVASQDGVTFIEPDSYTASILFDVLAESVHSGQRDVSVQVFESPATAGSSRIERSLKRISASSCWQWNTAVETLSTLREDSLWNNYVYGSLLKLQDKAQTLIPGHSNGADIAMEIVTSMIRQGVIPDLKTCTLAIKSMGKAGTGATSWKQALQLLDTMKSDTRFPDPNEYSYSAAISACAACGQPEAALDLLEEMRCGHVETRREGRKLTYVPPKPTTWVYNSVLSAIVKQRNNRSLRRSERKTRTGNQDLAFRLLEQMKEDRDRLGLETQPDTVSYNTVLSLTTTDTETDSHRTIISLLNEMDEEGVLKDFITYRNAILACSEGATVIQLVDRAFQDLSLQTMGKPKVMARQEVLDICNCALSKLAAQSNLKLFRSVLEKIDANHLELDSESLHHTISVLARTGKTSLVIPLLKFLDGGEEEGDVTKVGEAIGLSLNSVKTWEPSDTHYASAIEVCLTMDRIEQAKGVLSLMRENGMKPNAESLQSFASAYARAALRSGGSENIRTDISRGIARLRASNAYNIVMALESAQPRVLTKVTRACAYTSQWTLAQAVLRRLHTTLLSSSRNIERQSMDSIKGLHSNLLRECSKQGNVTAALWFANDIQNFATLVRPTAPKGTAVPIASGSESVDTLLASLREHKDWGSSSDVGMQAEDWVSMIRAASKSGHWRVCVNALQFLKSSVEGTNPVFEGDESSTLDDESYEHLVPAIVWASRCFEKRSQYAWAVRALDDWVGWSGRQPPQQAVLSAIRILSSRGRGEEVQSLLTRCIGENPVRGIAYGGESYAEALYLGAVTALHNNGLYDDADEVFISAINEEYLPFVFGKEDKGQDLTYALDLHGMNVAMAHSAVRVALRRLLTEESGPCNLMIITGRGRNSALQMRPVLRPEVQRMLLEEFYPPLNTVSVPGNTGAVLVYKTDVAAWQSHQQEQTGARMLALASVLKTASTDRLKSLALRLGSAKEQ